MALRRRRRMTRKQARMRRRRIRIAGFCLAGCILILGIVCGAFHHYVSQFPEDKIAENIYVGTVDLSGLSKKEALEKLAGQKKADQKQTVSLTVEGQKAEATLEECGFDYVDVKANVKAAMDYGKSGGLFGRYKSLRKLSKEKVVLSPEYTLDQKATENILEERAVPFAKHAQNATITKSGSGLQINKEEIGETVDKSGTIKAIKKHLNDSWDHGSFAMEAKVKEEQPSVTEADLSTIQDELGSFSTDAGGGERWKNLKNGVEKLNGTVVMPGEQISVHDVTAPYDEEHGYVQAGSYENGQVVDTYGGGICQVSTTLYNAVLFSELKVVKRYPHSMLVSYVPPSRDAAIAGDTKDFVFENNYDTPIYIFGEIDDDNQLCFAIYGKETRDKTRKIEFESEEVSTEEPGVKYKADAELALGEMEVTGSAHTGKEVKLWKIVYENGKQVSKDVINESTYSKADKTISVGIKTKNSSAAAVVKEAISTQDKAKIQAAISEASSMESSPEQ